MTYWIYPLLEPEILNRLKTDAREYDHYLFADVFNLFYTANPCIDSSSTLLELLMQVPTAFCKSFTKGSYINSLEQTKKYLTSYFIQLRKELQEATKESQVKEKSDQFKEDIIFDTLDIFDDIDGIEDNKTQKGSTAPEDGSDSETTPYKDADTIADHVSGNNVSDQSDLQEEINDILRLYNSDGGAKQFVPNVYEYYKVSYNLSRKHVLDRLLSIKDHSVFNKFVNDVYKKATRAGVYSNKNDYIDLLNIDIPDECINPENMLTQLTLLDSMFIQPKANTKVALYVDVSGSMSTRDHLVDANTNIERYIFACYLAHKLWSKKLIDKIYVWADNVQEVSLSDLIHINIGGGNLLYKVLDNIQEKKESAIILTDGEIELYRYIPHAWLLIMHSSIMICNSLPKWLEKNQISIWRNNKWIDPIAEVSRKLNI